MPWGLGGLKFVHGLHELTRIEFYVTASPAAFRRTICPTLDGNNLKFVHELHELTRIVFYVIASPQAHGRRDLKLVHGLHACPALDGN